MARSWWQDAVFYQVYPRSFQDSTGDGTGDLAGITARLPYLAETLGVGAVWVSPFYPSPMADFGYDVADYCDVDPRFGTLADFDELLATAHDLGLRLIVDWVPNHSSDRHPWFVESRTSRASPKRDWYVWADPRPGGGPPNNWLSLFGGPAWEWDAATGQYYLHSFLASQPDLNWRNPEVQEAMFGTVRFWLDRGVDGFRIDVAHFIMKDPELRDNPPAGGGELVFKDHGEYELQEHVHDKGHPDVHRVYRDLRRLLDGYIPERFAVGEIHVWDWQVWASYYGDGDELHMPYNFSLIHAPWEARVLRERIEAQEAAVPSWGWPNYVLGNHDEPRLATRFGPQNVRLAAMLLLTLRGTPTLYYGDEIGIRQVDIPDEEQQDPWGRQVPGMGRDGGRTPMQWDGSPGAGFTTGEPWLPLNDDWPSNNVAAQLANPGSLLNLYRELLALRRARRALREGSFRSVDAPDGVLAYQRETDRERLLVALNLTNRHQDVAVEAGRVVLSTVHARAAEVAGRVALAPREGVVVEPSSPARGGSTRA